jgi:hypothetical protein
MSGPIVRVGATPAYSKGWDEIFGKKKATMNRKKAKSRTKSRAVRKK